MKWLDKAYHKFLWFCGFREGEHISDMLARQKARFGSWWWFFPVTTFLAFLALGAFLVWLTIHIATFKLHNEQEGGEPQ